MNHISSTSKKADWLLYKSISKYHAGKIVEALAYGSPADATIAVSKALNFKCRFRVEPTLIATGDEIEKQLFN